MYRNRLFSDNNVSQGSVATYARGGEIFNNQFTANLPRNFLVKNVINWLRFHGIMAMTLWPHIFGKSDRRGVLVSGVRRMNEVNPRRARLVLGWVT